MTREAVATVFAASVVASLLWLLLHGLAGVLHLLSCGFRCC